MANPELSNIQQAVLRIVPSMGLVSGARVLDAPCGDRGALTFSLAEAGYDVVGVDLEPELTDSPGIAFQAADLEKTLPFPDASFDAVFSIEGIEHLENAFNFIREIRRVLKPGGKLALTTPNITSLRSRVRFLGSGFFGRDAIPLNESTRHPLHHIGLLTFPEIRYALVTAGFYLTAVRHTHIKPVSYLYGLWAPWMALYTAIAFRKEKDPTQRRANVEIRRSLMSYSLLFGENLLLIAERTT